MRETGFGAPVDADALDGEVGFGAPLEGGTSGTDTGVGEPMSFVLADLSMVLRRPFSTDAENRRRGFDAAFAEDGGELVEVRGNWPIVGPYRVQLEDMAGGLWPGAEAGCKAAVPEAGDRVYTNASGEFLRFALPKLPRGVYNLLVTWEGGSAVKPHALRVVGRRVLHHAEVGLQDIGTWPRIERLPSEITLVRSRWLSG
jgi:hypothetical protein